MSNRKEDSPKTHIHDEGVIFIKDKNEGDSMEPHSGINNVEANKSALATCKNEGDNRLCIDLAMKVPFTACEFHTDGLNQSKLTHAFFNKSPEKVNKGRFRPPTFKLGFYLSDNLLRFRTSRRNLRYIMHFDVVPTSKDPPPPPPIKHGSIKLLTKLHKNPKTWGCVPRIRGHVSSTSRHEGLSEEHGVVPPYFSTRGPVYLNMGRISLTDNILRLMQVTQGRASRTRGRINVLSLSIKSAMRRMFGPIPKRLRSFQILHTYLKR
ncbi:hypothetical protein HanIR_Chr16g0797861 [Helianthus annuus]|nr:hypothetical protein HanIR_Chr16g0797861 [Helianthus annuus]